MATPRPSYNSTYKFDPKAIRQYATDQGIDGFGGEDPYADFGITNEAPQPEPAPYNYNRYTPMTVNGPDSPKITSGNADEMALQDRAWAYHQGGNLDQQYVQEGNEDASWREKYRGQADAAYDPFLNGGGGYTDAENRDIIGKDGLNSLQLTEDEEYGNYLTPDEQMGMAGDPFAASKTFNPERGYEVQREGAGWQRGAYGNLERDMKGAVDPSKLGLSQGFGDQLQGAASQTESNLEGIYSDPNASVSEDFLNDYKMSDQEQQDIVTSAGISAGNRIRGAADAMDRKSRAAGMNPAGTAVQRQRFEQIAGGEAADANTKARVMASEAAAERLRRGEDMRVGYGQNLTGMKARSAEGIGDMRFRATETAEGMRLGAEQGISDRQSRAAQVSGLAALDTEARNADALMNTQRHNEQTGIALAQGADDRQVARRSDIALNRQATGQANQATKYTRGLAANDRMSARTAGTADARRTDQAEARGYVRGQQTQANTNVQNNQDRRGSLYNSISGNAGRATTSRSVAEGTPGTGERILGGVLGAGAGAAGAYFGGREKGGIITKPTYALLGEDGPEAIVPLGMDGDDDDAVLPSMALSTEQQPFDTSAPPQRGAATYGQRYRYARG